MPPVEETLANYLSQSEVSEAPILPSKQCQATLLLMPAYWQSTVAAGQAGAALHKMVLLQAYQVGLL